MSGTRARINVKTSAPLMLSHKPAARRYFRRYPRPPCLASFIYIVLAQLCATKSLAAETCSFIGTTNYAGHVLVTTTAAAVGDITRIDVALRFEATTTLWMHLHYLVEEISQWRSGALQRLDVNTRYVFAGSVVRQQWDEFRRTREGLQGYRIEGKRSAQFRRQFPGFAEHWNLPEFGQPWIDNYAFATPVRRPDLDLKAVQSAQTYSPFALALYWVRFLHSGEQHVQVFLPGFKADKLAALTTAPTSVARGRLWRATLQHPYLSASPTSTATALISPDERLRLLTFELHGSAGSASGTLHQAGCMGTMAR